MWRTVWLRTKSTQILSDGECRLTRVFNHIGVLTLNRPSRKNAIGRTLLYELRDCIHVCRDPAVDIRCLVLESSVDGVFCAGADLKERREMSSEIARMFVRDLRDTFTALEDLPIPTIAAVDGKALGGGCELALCADIRVASERAIFALPETSLAIIPGAGGTFRAPLIMGLSRALQMILTADQITAERALQFGLVNEVVSTGAAYSSAVEMAQRIICNGPIALAAAKSAVRLGYGRLREEALRYEREQYDVILQTQDRLEGLKAFAEKRKPKFEGK